MTYMNSYVEDYVGAFGYTYNQNDHSGFIFFKITASPGDLATSGQLNYSSYYSFRSTVLNWETNYCGIFAIKVNGVTKVEYSPLFENHYGSDYENSGFLNIAIGDIIGFQCSGLADNLAYTGHPDIGSTFSFFGADLRVTTFEPVPLPSTLLLLGSGLLGLTGWRRFKRRT